MCWWHTSCHAAFGGTKYPLSFGWETYEWCEVEVQKWSPALQQRCEWCLESNAKNAHLKGTVLVKLVEYSKENGAITIHPAVFTKSIKRILTHYKFYAKILPIPNHHWRGAVPSRTDTSNYSYLGLVSWREPNRIFLSFCENDPNRFGI